MKRYIIGLTFVLISGLGFSQINAEPGTYQLMTTSLKAKEIFTTSILSTIESSRLLNKIVIIKVGEHTWARILSLNTINDPNFIPLPSGIIGIDPNDPLIVDPVTVDPDINNSNN